jgi:HSP20 family protein
LLIKKQNNQRKEGVAMTTTYLERIFDPWREFNRMGRLFNKTATCEVCEYPAVNVWINGEEAFLNSEMPGIKNDELEITVSGNKVTLHGTRPADEIKEGESYQRHEIRHGEFKKTVQLPFNIDAEKVHASYRNGVLHVSLPQHEAEKPKKIEIKTE